MPKNVDVARLFERAAAGDQSAWREIIEIYNGRLYSFVRLRMRDTSTEDIDDIVQLTWGEVNRSVNAFSESAFDSPLQLIYPIAWRVLIKFYKRCRRDRLVMKQAKLNVDVPKGDEWRETRELEESMEIFSDTLPDREARVFNLKWAGCQVAEIADKLELTKGQIKRSLQNIRPKFKLFVEQLGVKI